MGGEKQLQQAAPWPPHGVCMACAPSNTTPEKKLMFTFSEYFWQIRIFNNSYIDNSTEFIIKMSFYSNYIQKYYGVVNNSQKSLHRILGYMNQMYPQALSLLKQVDLLEFEDSLSQMKERGRKAHSLRRKRDSKA